MYVPCRFPMDSLSCDFSSWGQAAWEWRWPPNHRRSSQGARLRVHTHFFVWGIEKGHVELRGRLHRTMIITIVPGLWALLVIPYTPSAKLFQNSWAFIRSSKSPASLLNFTSKKFFRVSFSGCIFSTFRKIIFAKIPTSLHFEKYFWETAFFPASLLSSLLPQQRTAGRQSGTFEIIFDCASGARHNGFRVFSTKTRNIFIPRRLRT